MLGSWPFLLFFLEFSSPYLSHLIFVYSVFLIRALSMFITIILNTCDRDNVISVSRSSPSICSASSNPLSFHAPCYVLWEASCGTLSGGTVGGASCSTAAALIVSLALSLLLSFEFSWDFQDGSSCFQVFFFCFYPGARLTWGGCGKCYSFLWVVLVPQRACGLCWPVYLPLCEAGMLQSPKPFPFPGKRICFKASFQRCNVLS